MVLSVELKYSKLGTVHWILDLDSGTTAQKTMVNFAEGLG
jgi:hypothetical protein